MSLYKIGAESANIQKFRDKRNSRLGVWGLVDKRNFRCETCKSANIRKVRGGNCGNCFYLNLRG